MRASSSASVISTRPRRVSDLSDGDIGCEALGGREAFGRTPCFVPASVRADAHAIARRDRAVEVGDERVVTGGGEAGPGRLRLFTEAERSDLDGVARDPRAGGRGRGGGPEPRPGRRGGGGG